MGSEYSYNPKTWHWLTANIWVQDIFVSGFWMAKRWRPSQFENRTFSSCVWMAIQYQSKIWTLPDFEWSKRGRFVNGLVLESHSKINYGPVLEWLIEIRTENAQMSQKLDHCVQFWMFIIMFSIINQFVHVRGEKMHEAIFYSHIIEPVSIMQSSEN